MKIMASTEKNSMMLFCASCQSELASSRTAPSRLKLASCSSDCRSRNTAFVASRLLRRVADCPSATGRATIARSHQASRRFEIFSSSRPRLKGCRIDPAPAARVPLAGQEMLAISPRQLHADARSSAGPERLTMVLTRPTATASGLSASAPDLQSFCPNSSNASPGSYRTVTSVDGVRMNVTSATSGVPSGSLTTLPFR